MCKMKAMQKLYAHDAGDGDSVCIHDQWKSKLHQKPLRI